MADAATIFPALTTDYRLPTTSGGTHEDRRDARRAGGDGRPALAERIRAARTVRPADDRAIANGRRPNGAGRDLRRRDPAPRSHGGARAGDRAGPVAVD